MESGCRSFESMESIIDQQIFFSISMKFRTNINESFPMSATVQESSGDVYGHAIQVIHVCQNESNLDYVHGRNVRIDFFN